MKILRLTVIMGLLICLCSCGSNGSFQIPDILNTFSKDATTTDAIAETSGEPYYIPSETLRDAMITLLNARSIPFQRQGDQIIQTDPVVPNRVNGWEETMSEGICETVFRVKIARMSPGETQLSVQALFPPSNLNQGKSCERSARSLEEGFLEDVNKFLMGSEGIATQERGPALEPGKTMAIAVRMANIRSGPSTRSTIITRLGHGSQVSVLAHQGDWVQINLASGEKGCIHGSLLEDVLSQDVAGEVASSPERAERESFQPLSQPVKTWPEVQEKAAVSLPTGQVVSTTEEEKARLEESEGQKTDLSETAESETAEASAGQGPVAPEPPESGAAKMSEAPSPAHQAETASPPPPDAVPVLLVRQGPAVDVFRDPNVFSPKIGKIDGGTRISSFERKGNFFKISHNALEGYIYKDFCTAGE